MTINPCALVKERDYGKWAEVVRWLEGAEARACLPAEREAAADCPEAGGGGQPGGTDFAEGTRRLLSPALYAGVDSAAPHIAAAVGTLTITIYNDGLAGLARRRYRRSGRQDRVPCRKGMPGRKRVPRR